MGNCLVIQDRDEDIKIMGMDGGEILTLQQDAALSVFPPSHGIVSDDDATLPAQQNLDPAAGMAVAGRLYHMFPAKAPPPAAAAAAVDTGGVVRVKLVISKQQLKKMLHKDAISLDDMVSMMQREASEQEMSCRGWRPALQSIPEGSDC